MPGRLEHSDWVRAALDAFERDGVPGLSIASLAQRLGATRGSFYWHFDSRDELLEATLRLWEQEHSDAVLRQAEAIDDPRERLRAIAEAATSKPPSIFVQLLYGARDEAAIRAVLERTAAARRAVLARAYEQSGSPPAEAVTKAALAYSLYVGLAIVDPPRSERMAITQTLARLLTP